MKLKHADIFIPDGQEEEKAFERTTHILIGAHQDDLEIMALAPILECYQQEDRWVSGVIVTDGSGSPRSGLYAKYTDEEMRQVRKREQKKAAVVGEYAAMTMLDYSSAAVKDKGNKDVVSDIQAVLLKAVPDCVYTHNLADKHDTHIAVALRVIEALRSMEPQARPKKVIGCEVWRGLDWLVDSDKVVQDCSKHKNLQRSLVGIFDSQISGGKHYDLAAMARQQANATYFESHNTDQSSSISFGLDLTPLVTDPSMDIAEYMQVYVDHLAQDIANRIKKLL